MQEPRLQQAASVSAPVHSGLESPTVRVIKPVKRRVKLADLWRGAQVIRVMAARDFKVKYKQSLLGPIWLLFQPIALLAGFFVAFRNLANVQPGVPYSVFALTGLSVWSFFQASMTIGASSLITNFLLVRFTPCPRFAFPIAGLIASLPTWVVTAFGAVVAAAATGTLSPRVLLMPLALVWLLLLTAGVVALAASLSVRHRDLIAALPFLLQIGLFLAPVGYPINSLGPTVRNLIELNPLTGLIEAVRWMTISDYSTGGRAILISLVMTAAIAVIGWRTFTRRETTIADEI
jgi:lipopolysaccharide transport system permease protein